MNFGIPTLADGWSKSKEYSNNAIILMRDNLYYLGIFNAKNKPDKKIIEGNTSENKGDYKKMIYNLLPGPNKMIPKVFLSSKPEWKHISRLPIYWKAINKTSILNPLRI